MRDSGGGWEMGDGRKGKVRIGKRRGAGIVSRGGKEGRGWSRTKA